ncbi:hypothetical protein KAJ38_00105 [Candidatus Pacearchaeota archaeon]|nr:hypothetical protein [Candidatus Pacearchaeota archaeon]
MALEYSAMNIKYDMGKGKFDISGDINKRGQHDVIEAFLRGQIGAGEDRSKANERDVYNIGLKWYPEKDRFECVSDTGNKGLRDGILLDVLGRLEK